MTEPGVGRRYGGASQLPYNSSTLQTPVDVSYRSSLPATSVARANSGVLSPNDTNTSSWRAMSPPGLESAGSAYGTSSRSAAADSTSYGSSRESRGGAYGSAAIKRAISPPDADAFKQGGITSPPFPPANEEERRTAESIRRRREEMSSANTPRVDSGRSNTVKAGSSRFSSDATSRVDPPHSGYARMSTKDLETATPTTVSSLQPPSFSKEDASKLNQDSFKDKMAKPVNYKEEAPRSMNSKEDLARKWLSAADGVLSKGPTTQERVAKLYEHPPPMKTPGGPSNTRLSHENQEPPSALVLKSNKHSVFSDDEGEEEDEQSKAQRKAERFIFKASTVLTEDKIVSQDPRVLPSTNCRVLLRSFRGTYLRWVRDSSRAMTGGSPFDVSSCEFVIEKVTSSPSKVLCFGDKIFMRDSRGMFLSGGDFTRDARGTWTLRRFVDSQHMIHQERSERGYVCSSDAIILEYDSNKRILGCPSSVLDGEGSAYATLEVTPLEETQRWHLVRSQGAATVFIPADPSDSSLAPKDPLLTSFDDVDGSKADSKGPRKPVGATRYLLDVCLGLYDFSTRVENQMKASEDLLLIDRLRPVASSVAFLRDYAKSRASPEWGRTCHALCFHLEEFVIAPFDEFCSQFAGTESLTAVFSAIQPRARLVLDWARVIQPNAILRGGTLLNALNAARLGQFESRSVCDDALARVARPMLRMAWLWMTRGVVEDPFGEFCIVDNVTLTPEEMSKSFNSKFWTHKFTQREDKVIPWFLRAHMTAVLRGGRDAYASSGKKNHKPKLKTGNVARLTSSRHQGTPKVSNSSGLALKTTMTSTRINRPSLNILDEATHPHMTVVLTRKEAAEPESTSSIQQQGITKAMEWQTETTVRASSPEDEEHTMRDFILEFGHANDFVLGDVLTRMHRSASTRLLSQLVDAQLFARLDFLKKYFLLDHMDFFLRFIDSNSGDLLGLVRKGSDARLRVALRVALRETCDAHGIADDVSCVLLPFAIDSHVERIHNETEVTLDEFTAAASTIKDPLLLSQVQVSASAPYEEFASSFESLRGVDAFALDMQVSWPLSVVLSKRTLTKYQLLFRHLFRCKHAEKRVAESWFKAAGRGGEDPVAQGLILRMTHFLQSLQYYMAYEVLEPRWRDWLVKAKEAKDVDDLLKAHEDMLDSCLKGCLLTNANLIKHLSRLLRLCLSLGDLVLDPHEGMRVQCDPIRVSELDQELVSFLEQLRTEANKGQIRTEHLYNLATRLDFTDFYGVLAVNNSVSLSRLRHDDDDATESSY